jgi:hypothetical protein
LCCDAIERRHESATISLQTAAEIYLGVEAWNDAADAHAVLDRDRLVSTMLLFNEVKALVSRPAVRCRRRQWR